MSLNPNGAPASFSYQTGATAYLIDSAGAYSPAAANAPTTDPAGTDDGGADDGAGANAPMLAAAGVYIPITGAASVTGEIADPAGAEASAATMGPAGTDSGAGANAPMLAAAGNTAASPYALDRLFLENNHNLPFNEVLSFNSVTKVENFFGVRSAEATLAKEFFSGYSGSSAHMLFDRMPIGGGRARIFGANISDMTLAQLQAINGTLSVTSEGYNFKASINLASATSFANAASLIQSALNAAQPTEATTTGSSIAPESASFTGSIEGGLMQVTAVSGGRIAIGGRFSKGYAGHIVAQESGVPGGVGVYSVWYGAPANRRSIPPGTPLSETYGILTIGTVNSGTVAVGQEVTGSGVAANTAIQANIRGSGFSSGSQWVVDLTQTVASEALAMKAAPLKVHYHRVVGATVNSDSFYIEANGAYPVQPTTVNASGTVADLLGLTQSAGAYFSTPGQITTSPSAWLNNIVNNENSHWSSFQMTYPTAPYAAEELSDWSAGSGGQFQYLSGYTTSTPPITSAAVDPPGTYSSAGAGAPTPADPGAYIPVTSATSSAAELVDAAGIYTGAGASAATPADPVRFADPLGRYGSAFEEPPSTPAGDALAFDAWTALGSRAGSYSGGFDFRHYGNASGARDVWGVGFSWNGSAGHGPGSSS